VRRCRRHSKNIATVSSPKSLSQLSRCIARLARPRALDSAALEPFEHRSSRTACPGSRTQRPEQPCDTAR
jgi:hypothetical protein